MEVDDSVNKNLKMCHCLHGQSARDREASTGHRKYADLCYAEMKYLVKMSPAIIWLTIPGVKVQPRVHCPEYLFIWRNGSRGRYERCLSPKPGCYLELVITRASRAESCDRMFLYKVYTPCSLCMSNQGR